ncbi:hypothetical protein RchiOBHm_Chr4g0430351 [Rosa chinensis]|uniref:Uncharacterized protein n=1 Tax=Rosa chinensis TaxID=74649 RepID=A0A2P6R0E8_ROSCH|nr:hypothetical protein RchiOBHm_Chr4g0430351 [Rosa chinensis]
MVRRTTWFLPMMKKKCRAGVALLMHSWGLLDLYMEVDFGISGSIGVSDSRRKPRRETVIDPRESSSVILRTVDWRLMWLNLEPLDFFLQPTPSLTHSSCSVNFEVAFTTTKNFRHVPPSFSFLYLYHFKLFLFFRYNFKISLSVEQTRSSLSLSLSFL